MDGILYNLSLKRAAGEVKSIIDGDLSRHLLLKDLARAACINECSLKKGFKARYKTSIYQYLLSKRMNYARELITGTVLQEKEIAFCCGYESLGGFINAFRKRFGIAPGMLRTRCSEQMRV